MCVEMSVQKKRILEPQKRRWLYPSPQLLHSSQREYPAAYFTYIHTVNKHHNLHVCRNSLYVRMYVCMYVCMYVLMVICNAHFQVGDGGISVRDGSLLIYKESE